MADKEVVVEETQVEQVFDETQVVDAGPEKEPVYEQLPNGMTLSEAIAKLMGLKSIHGECQVYMGDGEVAPEFFVLEGILRVR